MRFSSRIVMLCMAFLVAATAAMANGNKPFKVTTKASSGGMITPRVANPHEGEVKTFSIRPDAGYHVVSVVGCGGTWNASTLTYTTAPAAADCEISALFHFGPNKLPIVSAGQDQTVTEGSPVALSGTASDPDGNVVSVLWKQISGPPAVITSASSLYATFVAPSIAVDSVCEFELTVIDNEGARASDGVSVSVLSTSQKPTYSVIPGLTDWATAVSLGDVNGDGICDLGIVEGDVVYVLYGGKHLRGLSKSPMDYILEGNGYTITGGDADYSWNIQPTGDVNGDGLCDIALIRRGMTSGMSDLAYILPGQRDGIQSLSTPEIGNLKKYLLKITSGDSVNLSCVIQAGDVNGDSIGDLNISAYAPTNQSALNLIYYGKRDAVARELVLQLPGVDFPEFRIGSGVNSPDFMLFKANVSDFPTMSFGDINGDGISDFSCGSGSIAQAGYGVNASDLVDLPGWDGRSSGEMTAIRAIDYAHSMKFADVNGDGIGDIIVGSSYTVVVRYGELGKIGTVDCSSISASNDPGLGYRIEGSVLNGNDFLNSCDFNGDGISDIIVSGYGGAYVVYGVRGSVAPDVNVDDLPEGKASSSQGCLIATGNKDTSFGNVLGTGDFDGDGIPDVIISADDWSPDGSTSRHRLVLVFGKRISDVPDVNIE